MQKGLDDGSILWTLAPELIFSVLSYVDGKALSTFMEALLASEKKRVLVGHFIQYLSKRWHNDICRLLLDASFSNLATPTTTCNGTQCSQPALMAFVRQTMIPKTEQILVAQECSAVIRNFSEWCILLDYVLQGPRSASCRGRMVWPMGTGVFTTTAGSIPLRSRVVLHCPVWNPLAVILCQDIWLSSDQQSQRVGAPTHFNWLPSEGDLDGFDPDVNIGILTPLNDNNTRTFRGIQALTRNDDFLHGTGRPDSCLSILPSLDCPVYGSLVHQVVQTSTQHAWMIEDQQFNLVHNKPSMLCFFDSHPKYSAAVQLSSSQPSLENRIIQIMKALER